MGSREKRTAELENFLENLRNSDDMSADEIDKETVDRIQAEGDDEPSKDEKSQEHGESEGAQKQQRAMKIQRVFKSTRKGCGSSVGDSSESFCGGSGNCDYDGGCSTDENDVEITQIENGKDSMDDAKEESSWEVVNDNSPKIEMRSERQDNTSKNHGIPVEDNQISRRSKNEDRLGQRENDKKRRRRGDADEPDDERGESPNEHKRMRRHNEVDESPATDNIIQIMKFIRRMALLSDERLMQNLQHGFPLHAQDTILTGFRIIEWFQGMESDLEDL